jgi:hypothetical protein
LGIGLQGEQQLQDLRHVRPAVKIDPGRGRRQDTARDQGWKSGMTGGIGIVAPISGNVRINGKGLW